MESSYKEISYSCGEREDNLTLHRAYAMIFTISRKKSEDTMYYTISDKNMKQALLCAEWELE